MAATAPGRRIDDTQLAAAPALAAIVVIVVAA
jgi:hypothetical protein